MHLSWSFVSEGGEWAVGAYCVTMLSQQGGCMQANDVVMDAKMGGWLDK